MGLTNEIGSGLSTTEIQSTKKETNGSARYGAAIGLRVVQSAVRSTVRIASIRINDLVDRFSRLILHRYFPGVKGRSNLFHNSTETV